jgi:ADP-dependent NAD(P)H-hydrate dehydratase / NAD(P)H-hydrate epimerase
MRVISATSMAKLESEAYLQGFAPENFMEEAGKNIVSSVESFLVSRDKQILLLCGKGNNGGDTFVAGRYLLNLGFRVLAIQWDSIENCAPLCQKNRASFLAAGGSIQSECPESIQGFSLILDGLFGTGFRGEVLEPYASLIKAVNNSGVPIFAIDIPSGLNGDTGEIKGPVIQATRTLYLELPKLGFFLGRGWDYVGDLEQILFGLPFCLINNFKPDFEIIDRASLPLPITKRSWNKYERGHVVGLAGSPNMPGAAILSCLAAMRGGAGIVRLLYPEGMQAELTVAPYELIRMPYQYDQLDEALSWLNKASASFIGPGLGRSDNTISLLKKIIPDLKKPCVIDADALTIWGQLALPWPKGVVLTPHTGEIGELIPALKPFNYSKETLRRCQEYVEINKVTLVCKGSVTFIFHPNEPIYANIVSDPSMATAGSGDVLTGLIASFLAQGLTPHQAAMSGVYFHGLAGKKAAEYFRGRSIIASDIINFFKEE